MHNQSIDGSSMRICGLPLHFRGLPVYINRWSRRRRWGRGWRGGSIFTCFVICFIFQWLVEGYGATWELRGQSKIMFGKHSDDIGHLVSRSKIDLGAFWDNLTQFVLYPQICMEPPLLSAWNDIQRNFIAKCMDSSYSISLGVLGWYVVSDDTRQLAVGLVSR